MQRLSKWTYTQLYLAGNTCYSQEYLHVDRGQSLSQQNASLSGQAFNAIPYLLPLISYLATRIWPELWEQSLALPAKWSYWLYSPQVLHTSSVFSGFPSIWKPSCPPTQFLTIFRGHLHPTLLLNSSFIYSLIQRLFLEHLPSSRYCSRYRRYNGGENTHGPWPHGA